jgi:hypothetical protein
VGGKSTCVWITRVSHTSRDIFVKVSKQGGYAPVSGVSPTSCDRFSAGGAVA